jgi:hypothetical protein
MLLALGIVVLGVLVRVLFQEKKQLRSDLEMRLQAIENLEGPFARGLADSAPAPMKRALSLNIQLDAGFWAETLQLAPSELEEIRKSVRTREGFITVHIQEWRGGYTHIRVRPHLCPHEKETTFELFRGNRPGQLWRFRLPERPGEWGGSTLSLDWDGRQISLYAIGGRFESASAAERIPVDGNVFLKAPTEEGPRAEPYFKPCRKVEFYPDVYRFLAPWERCYEHGDAQRGLSWELWIEDCELLARSRTTADGRQRLLAGWHERFAWNDEGKEWYQRVERAVKDVFEKEMAELTPKLADIEAVAQPGLIEEA